MSSSSSSSSTTSSTTRTTSNRLDNDIKVLGVCGGIGSGKSTACQILVNELLGGPSYSYHIEADRIAHQVYRPGSDILVEVADEFGSHLVDETTGELNRKELGAIVFSDKAAMSRLERIVWPHVRKDVEAILEEKKQEILQASSSGGSDDGLSSKRVIVLEAAMLLEANWDGMLDGIWVVQSDAALDRLQENRGLSKEEAEKRIAAQQNRRGIGNLDDEVATGLVSCVIQNHGGLEALKENLKAALNDSNCWYAPKSEVTS